MIGVVLIVIEGIFSPLFTSSLSRSSLFLLEEVPGTLNSQLALHLVSGLAWRLVWSGLAHLVSLPGLGIKTKQKRSSFEFICTYRYLYMNV